MNATLAPPTIELTVGQKATRSMQVTAAHVRTYAELSGDYNPLHFDEDFCAKTRFGRLVAQGGLTTGLLHALVAMDMPGPGTVFLNQNWKFTAPVYIGDTITAEATVLEVHADEAGVAPRGRDSQPGRRRGARGRGRVLPDAARRELRARPQLPRLTRAGGTGRPGTSTRFRYTLPV